MTDASESRPLADRIRQKAGSVDVTTIVGLPGSSDEPGTERIYLSPSLDIYVEVASEDVVHTEALAGERSSAGMAAVWVRKGARLKHTHVVAADAQRQFLRGPVTDRYLSGRAPALGPTGGVMPHMYCEYYTGDTVFWCESRYVCVTGRCGGSNFC